MQARDQGSRSVAKRVGTITCTTGMRNFCTQGDRNRDGKVRFGPVRGIWRTLNRTVGSVQNGPVQVLKVSEPELDLFFLFSKHNFRFYSVTGSSKLDVMCV